MSMSCSLKKPNITGDGYDLGSWAKNVRNKRKRGELPERHIKRLETIPEWVWDQTEFVWNQKFEMLSEYAKNNNSKQYPQIM